MKKLILVISFTLSFLFIIICLKNECGRMLYKNANYGMEKLIRKGKIDNLFIGSSMFRQGLDIISLEKTIGEDSFILAYNGNQPIFEYFELDYLIKNGVKIKNLYVDMYVYTLAAKASVCDTRLLAQTNTKLKFDIWNTLAKNKMSNLSVFWELFITANNESFLSFPISYPLTNNLYYKGGNIKNNDGTTISKLSELEVPSAEGNKPNISQLNSIIEMIKLCKQNKINLYFLETPKWHKVSEDHTYQDLMKQYINILTNNQITFSLSSKTAECLNYTECNIIDFDSENPKFFIDMVHMSSAGRENYGYSLYK